MVNWDLVSLLIFYVLLLLIYFRFKEKFTTQGLFVMYRTTFGLKQMDRWAQRAPRVFHLLSSLGVVVGFVGMVFILVFLIKETIKLLTVPGTAPALAPVLPGIEIAGAPTLSFWHWIIAIFVVAVVHEFSHGLVARTSGIPIKSSGFAFLGPLLAAFVEPDENELKKKSAWDQLKVFAAGPFSNLLFGVGTFLVLLFIIAPVLGGIYEGQGVIVHETIDGYPMNLTGIAVPFTITEINGQEIKTFDNFLDATAGLTPGETVDVGTDQGAYTIISVANPENESKAFFGITGFEQKLGMKESYQWLEPADGMFMWARLLLIWMFLIHIGVGLFNLLPLGPVDGGRMFYTFALSVLKTEKRAKNALISASVLCLALIIINMLPWINKLFLWLSGLFSLLIAILG